MFRKLLLADDSATIQRVVEISFEGTDIRVHSASDGEKAMAMAKKIKPDIVLADVELPGVDGLELCRRLKADPELQSVPVLLLTNSFETFDEDAGLEAGAAGCIPKPFESENLVQRVQSILPEATGEREEEGGVSEEEALPAPGVLGADEDLISDEEEALGEELEKLGDSEEEEELEEILEELSEHEDNGHPPREELLAEELALESEAEPQPKAEEPPSLSPPGAAPVQVPREELRQIVSDALSGAISSLIPELRDILREAVREQVPPLAERLIREEIERLKGGK